MEIKKVCIHCKEEKALSEYYKNNVMCGGYFNACKICLKIQQQNRYNSNIEKERERGREKYARLGYRFTQKSRHPESKQTSKYFKEIGVNLEKKEIHHWNYNRDKDVFLLHPRAHKLVHKYLDFDEKSNMFKNKEGILIDNKKMHYDLMIKAFSENNVVYEIESLNYNK